MSASDWAKRMVQDLKREKARDQIETEAFVARQNILNAFGKKLWAELRAEIKSTAEAFNVESGNTDLLWIIGQPDRAVVRLSNGSVLVVVHDDPTHTITVEEGITPPRSFSIVVEERTGTAILCEAGNKVPLQPNKIAESLIGNFLRTDFSK